MTQRLFIMALTVLILAAVISACDDGTWHWITPEPPITVEPDMVPEKSLIPTITPDSRDGG